MHRKLWGWIGLMAGVWILLIAGLQWFKYQSFGYNGLDLGIYSQVLWSLSHGHGFASSIHDPSYLGDHLELWLVPLAGLYRLWSNPLTALWTQTVVLAVAVIPLAHIAKRYVGRRGTLITVGLWLLHPLLYNAALYEFHGLVFALPVLFWTIDRYLAERWGHWMLGLVALALVREDMPLLIAGWAIFAALNKKSWRWWAVPGVLAVGWFLTAQAIIQSVNPLENYKYLAFYRWLGQTLAEMLAFPFQHPLVFLGHVFSAANWQTVIGFLVTFGLLPLWGWKKLLPLSLAFFQLLLLGAPADSILRLHYVIPYLPFLAWAALEGWQRIRAGLVFPRLDRELVVLGATALVMIGPVYGHLLYGAAEWPWSSRAHANRTPAPILQSVVNQIGPRERVLTTFNLLPALSGRERVYSLNYLHLGRRQYTESPYSIPVPIDVAVIDWQQYYEYQFLYRDTLYRNLTGIERLQQLLDARGLTLVAWHDSVAIYRRGGLDSFEPVMRQPQSSTPGPLRLVTHTPAKLLTDPGFETTKFREIEIGLQWENSEALNTPISLHFTLTRGQQLLWESTRILGQGTNSTETWLPENQYLTVYRLAIPKAVRGQTSLAVESLALEGRMRLDRWRSFAPKIYRTKSLGRYPLGSLQL